MPCEQCKRPLFLGEDSWCVVCAGRVTARVRLLCTMAEVNRRRPKVRASATPPPKRPKRQRMVPSWR